MPRKPNVIGRVKFRAKSLDWFIDNIYFTRRFIKSLLILLLVLVMPCGVFMYDSTGERGFPAPREVIID